MNEILTAFQSFRRILCICPHCGDLVRLSDLRLKYRGVAPRTWLDTYQSKLSLVQKREELFDGKEKQLRDEAADRGRRKVSRMIRKSLSAEFAKLKIDKYDPYDIKAILHPVDYVVFDGYNRKNLDGIVFLSKEAPEAALNEVRKSVRETVDKERYHWRLARVSTDGKIEFE